MAADLLEFSLPENPLPARLQNYRLRNRLTDITIKVGEEIFPAHRVALEDSSPVLKALLSENWSNKTDYELNEQFVDSMIMEDLLTYLYTAKITITSDNAHALCMAAHYLHILTLVSVSEKFLSERISATNVLDLFFLADKLELQTLRKRCVDCLCENYETVLKDTKLIGFTSEDLQIIMREMNQKSENDQKMKELMFEMITNWVENDPSTRSASYPSLLKSIPLNGLSHKFLSENVATQNTILDSQSCSRLLIEAMSKASISSQKTSKISKESGYVRLYSFGGRDQSGKSLSSVSQFDMSTNLWTSCPPMSVAKYDFGGAVIGNKIYICGGYGGKTLNTMEMFDCSTNTWTQLTPMPQTRYECAAATLNGFVYVAGGRVENGEKNSVIRYNVQTDQWQTVKSMNQGREDHQLVTLNGRLYAICGHGTDTVEVYNPSTDEWTFVASTQYKHFWFGATSHNGKIYVCSDKGFEVYSPQSNTWQILSSLKKIDGQTLVSAGNKLLAVGGEYCYGGAASIFSYDISADRWTQMPDMDVARKRFCSFVVNC